ncbi:MAG: aldehyde dehydrogenase family protein [Coriobacteriales bacterium]|jgi:acyl-CoA reductase-like NAD-dependent aldehyde dehydrogenase
MQMFIDGKPVDSSDGKTVEITNPSDGSVIDTVPVATEADVQHTFDVARKAQKEWAAKPVYERAEIMMKFLDLVERDKDDLAETLMKENGKPITEAEGEIANIFISFKAFSERAKHLYGSVIYGNQEPGQEAHTQIIKREPIGIVVAVIPFNFPCDLFDQKVAPALLAGNSVIVKPSTDNPLTLCKLTALLGEAGVTPGAINIVTGPGSTVGHWLTVNEDADVITLTGSTAVGIETARVAADHLAHVTLELGGNDAFIVCDDADIDLAVEEMIWGRFYNCGQVCCASKRFLVQKSVKEEFEKKAIERIKKIKVGKPEDRSTELACLISEKAAKKVEDQVNKTIEQGGKLLLGGKRDGAYYEPTVITDIPKTADVATDMEIFGPVVSIIAFDTIDEAIEIANSSKFGLCGCVFTEDQKRAFDVTSRLECGGAIINGASFFRAFEQPFGGYKYSGYGNEGVQTTFDEVTRTKSIILKNVAI